MIDLKIAEHADIGVLMDFIREKWNHNHILASNRALFDWQHLNPITNKYNFLLAIDPETNKIVAILGFIPTYQYDQTLLKNGDYYGAIWKMDTLSGIPPGLGHFLFKTLQKQPHFTNFGAIGVSNDTKKYMKILGYNISHLNHYYILNDNITKLKIASIKNKEKKNTKPTKGKYSLKRIKNLSLIGRIESKYKPIKTIDFLINKYAKHPIYSYMFYGVYNPKDVVSILVIRKVNQDNANCLRIIDCIGELNIDNSLHQDFQDLLYEFNSEYIDFYNYGIPQETIEKLGFQLKGTEDIIPNYFEPFEKKNIVLDCIFNSSDSHYTFFKGDSDQDRPNKLTS